MNFTHKILSAFALLALPVLVAAQPSYTHIDLSYVSLTPSSGPTQDGVGIGGSYAFADNLHAVAVYSDVDSNRAGNRVSTLMLGHRIGLNERSDFVIRGGWMEQKAQHGGNSATKDGYVIMLGTRNMITENIELNAWGGAHRTFRSRASIGVEGVYHINERFGAFAAFDTGNTSARTIRGVVRIAF